MNAKPHLFIILIVYLSLTSCARIYLRIIGVKKPRAVNKEVLATYLYEQNVHPSQILEVDSVRYQQLIEQKQNDTLVYKNAWWWVQNHVQPSQVILIDKLKDRSVASYFNCIAESRGINNFTYNKFHELEFFPPLTYSDPRWIDTIFTTQEILRTFNEVNGKTYKYQDDGKRYLALVFYTLMIEKQSTNIIRETNMHINQCIKDSCQVLYINMDNYMYQQMR